MAHAERIARERAEREHRIVAAARVIAERDGWDAVTVRHLADEIEYSRPVLYSHFQNRTAIVVAVAVEGFREITVALLEAASGSTGKRNALENVAIAYLAFAHIAQLERSGRIRPSARDERLTLVVRPIEASGSGQTSRGARRSLE